MRNSTPKHLYLLDILRGVASLAIVVWHYQHFFYVAPGELAGDFARASQPLYSVLWPIYDNGYYAVQLFFVLSGFVFYFNYADRIRSRSISMYDFFVFRFARLYPLYFVTLIFVAFVQLNADSTLGSFIVYPMNDLRHFLLSLFFASDWGMQYGFSFNAPTWSVSVEILLYAVFIIVVRALGRSAIMAIIMALTGCWMAFSGMEHIGWGLYCFFAGGIVFLIYERWRPIPLLFTATIILILSAIVYGFLPDVLKKALLFGVSFPALVLLLTTIQSFNPSAGRSIRIIGDITYATYLLHFPIQLSAIWVTRYYGITIDYTDAIWLVLFLSSVILMSIPTYYFFEVPAQSFLRQRLKLSGSTKAAT